MNRSKIKIYTDGSCSVQHPLKKGGFGVYAPLKDKEVCLRRGYWNTTTSRMEMFAFLEAIKMVNTEVWTNVTIYSDSQFVVNSFKQGYINKWRTSDWIGVKNAEIWKEIVKEIDIRRKMVLGIQWLNGHQKDLTNDDIFGNNCADALADYKTQDSYTQDKPLDGFSWFLDEVNKKIFVDKTDNFAKLNKNNRIKFIGDCYYTCMKELIEHIKYMGLAVEDYCINMEVEKI